VTLDADHDAVIECTARHQVVLAPPGAGKTHLSVRLAGYLAGDISRHSRILLLTFSRQARAQLEREAAAQLNAAARQRVEITNYHRLFWNVVRSYRRVLGLPMDLDIGSSQRRKQVLNSASPSAATLIARHRGLPESLAEHAFPEFQDARTPGQEDLCLLLSAIEAEYRRGSLVFDDLGALFWRLFEAQPTVAEAYVERYPIVIADEHQDATALQDSVARRFGSERLVVLGDTMQLIHRYRGASLERFQAHRDDCDIEHKLRTAHRWRRANSVGEPWIKEVRKAMYGGNGRPGRPMRGFSKRIYVESRGTRGVAQRVVDEVRDAWPNVGSVAVLTRRRNDLVEIEKQLLRRGYFPRRIGNHDFEDLRRDIEQLRDLTSVARVRKRVLDRVYRLVPTLAPRVRNQLRRRLRRDAIDRSRAPTWVTPYLDAMEPVYAHGAAGYVHAFSALLVVCESEGFHCPSQQQTRTLHDAAARRPLGSELSTVISTYAEAAMQAAMAPQRTERGIFLMTAHQAKGKEFDAVIIAKLSAEEWPNDEQTRKLLYVALTRATHRWCLIAPHEGPSELLSRLP
jgi:superfamily I DNA/RNA helicase